MESEGCSKVCKLKNESDSSDCSNETSKHDAEGTQKVNKNLPTVKDDPVTKSDGKMEIEAEEDKNNVETRDNTEQDKCKSDSDETDGEDGDNQIPIEDSKAVKMIAETSFNTNSSIVLSVATTSQDNTPSLSTDNDLSTSLTDQTKIKRSISKGQINGDSGISTEKSGNSSDEDSSKRQRLTECECDKTNSEEDNLVETTLKFHKLKSKVKKRNYRNRRSLTGETGDSCNETGDDDAEVPEDTHDVTRRSEDREEGADGNSDWPDSDDAADDSIPADSNEWSTRSKYELEDESDGDLPPCLKKEKPKTDFFVLPELIKRELGVNPYFRQKYYGSLHVVQHFELKYRLDEHEGCVNTLSFNQKGNLLASGSDDLLVFIWDWALEKKHHFFDSGHRSNLFQAKWLPFDAENLMVTCARDGEVRLLDLPRGISRKIATHHAPTHKLAVHPDTPHVIISVGEDAKVLSIDIRERKPTKLLFVKDGSSEVQLYSVHSNPLNSNEFCIGGRSPCVRIYDRRNVSRSLYKLCPDHLAGNKHAHVTCAVYNYNGTEILSSYNDEDIYLFDAVMPQAGDYAHRYQGHRNNATVKGVNFFGPKSEFIVSGSDCSNIFIWDKNTEAIVNWIPVDEQGVVNCLEPHPYIPYLATSGLDFDVKIFAPSSETPPAMTNLKHCVKYNAINRAQGVPSESNTFDRQLFLILLRHVRYTLRVTQDLNTRSGFEDRDLEDEDDSSNDNDSSDHSDSQSEGDGSGRLQCPLS